ncbi:MAG: NAD(P)/FAD-dependent oxidoreductase [Enterocloster clostridioformis]
MKSYEAIVMSVNPFANAQVCCGGVDTREVDAATMESGIHANLYLAGELLDVDGICGGYNLQFAWSSGMIAGVHAAGRIFCGDTRGGQETGRRHILEHMALPQGKEEQKMIRINQLKMPLGHDRAGLLEKAARVLRVPSGEIEKLTIVKQSVDARKKPDIWYSYVVDIGIRQAGLQKEEKLARRLKDRNVSVRKETPYRLLGRGPILWPAVPSLSALARQGCSGRPYAGQKGIHAHTPGTRGGRGRKDRPGSSGSGKLEQLNPSSNVQFGGGRSRNIFRRESLIPL